MGSRGLSVCSEAQEKQVVYPYGTGRVLWSATITILSVVLAILMLRDLVSALYCVILTTILAVIVLAFKMRFLRTRLFESYEDELDETKIGSASRKPFLVLIVALFGVLLIPLLLARFQPELWFASLISYTSGVSVAEILFFLVTRRR